MITDILSRPKPPRVLAYAPPPRGDVERIEEVAARLKPAPIQGLDEVALQLRTLPYANFMEFAEHIGAEPKKVWQWAVDRRVQL